MTSLSNSKNLEIISLGASVQSTVMALMTARGQLNKKLINLPSRRLPDAAIFADTQFEPPQIYDHLNWLEKLLPFPVFRVTTGNLKEDTLQASRFLKDNKGRFATVPFFTLEGNKRGMARRQCTNDYKIVPIRKKLRELIGLKAYQRVPKETKVRVWIGISTDEAMRMKPSRDAWVENVWPLIDAKMSRQDCLAWFEKNYPDRSKDFVVFKK